MEGSMHMKLAGQVLEEMIATVERRDSAAYAALYSREALARHPLFPEGLVGRDRIRAEEDALYQAFDEVRVEVRRLVAQDRHAAASVVLRARHSGPLDLGDGAVLPPSGREIALLATWWIALGEDGLIEESEDHFDVAALTEQLGLGQEAVALAHRYFEELVNQRGIHLVEELFAPDFVNHAAPPGQQTGTDAMVAFLASLQRGFPDFRGEVDEIVPAGDRAAVRFTFRGTHTGEFAGLPPTGRRVTMSGIDLIRVAGGRIVELWGQEDWRGLFQQLGAPNPAEVGSP